MTKDVRHTNFSILLSSRGAKAQNLRRRGLLYIGRSQTFQAAVLILATIAVYFPALGNDFLYRWDDQLMVINHYTSGGWSFSNLKSIFTDFYSGQYAPLLEFTTLVLYSIDLYNPVIFHLAGLLWQIGNVLLIWLFIKRLLGLRKDGNRLSIPLIAFLTAFLFAVHPINVEAVAWLSAMKILIYAFFFFLGLISYISYIRTRRISRLIYTALCFLLSFFGKEQAVTFPLVIVLIDWFAGRSLKDKSVWTEKIIFFSMASLFGVTTILSQGISGDPNTYRFFHRITFAGYALFEYISKSVLPVKLNFLYPFPMLPNEDLPLHFLLYPVLALLVGIWVYFNRNKKLLVFWTLFFVINLLFSINLIPMSRNTIAADRYLYISVISVIFLILYAARMFRRKYKNPVIILFSAYCLYLGAYTFNYTKQWKDSDTIREYMQEVLKQRDSQTTKE
jgi:hypothetical protein